MAKGIKLFVGNIDKGFDIADLVGNDRVSVSRTPIGAEPGQEQWYLKKAVSWKGAKVGKIGDDEDEFVKRAIQAGIPANTAKALFKIAKDSVEIKKMLGPEAYGLLVVEYGGRKEVLNKVAYLKLVQKLIAAGRQDILASMKTYPYSTKKLRITARDEYAGAAYHVPAGKFVDALNVLEAPEVKKQIFNPAKVAMAIKA